MGALWGYELNEQGLEFVRKAYKECTAFLTICAGFVAAKQAGLLKGKTVAAPRFMLGDLRKSDPGTKWVERRWAHDGKVLSSGTLLNGLDIVRAFAEYTWGSEGGIAGPLLEIGAWPVSNTEFS
jgi:transcriptional regulator GlxA family with amidase domain